MKLQIIIADHRAKVLQSTVVRLSDLGSLRLRGAILKLLETEFRCVACAECGEYLPYADAVPGPENGFLCDNCAPFEPFE